MVKIKMQPCFKCAAEWLVLPNTKVRPPILQGGG